MYLERMKVITGWFFKKERLSYRNLQHIIFFIHNKIQLIFVIVVHTSISPKKTKKRPVETTVEVFIFFFSVFSIFVIGFYIYIA